MPDEELDQMDSIFDPGLFDPATAAIDEVWTWLCEHIPGLRESPGLGIPPNNKAGPMSYCEGRLYFLLGQTLGHTPVWSSAYFPEGTSDGECHVIVDMYTGYGYSAQYNAKQGRGEARCAWGDTSRMPAKEARLRAAADLILKHEALSLTKEKPCP